MQNKNWKKIKKEFNSNFNIGVNINSKIEVYGYAIMKDENDNCTSCYNSDIINFFKKQFQNQRQEFVDIVEKEKRKNESDGKYFNAGISIILKNILEELNK